MLNSLCGRYLGKFIYGSGMLKEMNGKEYNEYVLNRLEFLEKKITIY